jgi:propionyl-CoA carboxylase alpha chain
MLSKIISYAPTREEAIAVLSDGLDSYVIEGVKHNAKLVQAVLRHPSFQSGTTPTSFLERDIPDFSEYRYDGDDSNSNSNGASATGSLLSAAEEEELAAAVAVISRARVIFLGRPPVVGGDGGKTVVVRLDGLFGNTDALSVTVVDEKNEARVRRMGIENAGTESHRVIALNQVTLDPEHYLAKITLDGIERTIQVLNEQQSGELKVQMHGAEYPKCLVQSPREYELSLHMLPPVIEDTSNFVMSPMPGTLIGFSGGLSEGDAVKEDQELCVVEAMKMQNIIRAPREGIVSKIYVEEGATLITDQIIIEFEAEGDEEELASVA